VTKLSPTSGTFEHMLEENAARHAWSTYGRIRGITASTVQMYGLADVLATSRGKGQR
jgi:hypothetical protein